MRKECSRDRRQKVRLLGQDCYTDFSYHCKRISIRHQRHNMVQTFLKEAHSQEAQDTSSPPHVVEIVKNAIAKIRAEGDAAVREFSEKFDKWSPQSFRLTQEQIDASIAALPEQTVKDIKQVQANVRRFAEAQRSSLTDFEIETQPGVILGQKNVPIEKVGCYIPGGRYPLLASAHMTVSISSSRRPLRINGYMVD